MTKNSLNIQTLIEKVPKKWPNERLCYSENHISLATIVLKQTRVSQSLTDAFHCQPTDQSLTLRSKKPSSHLILWLRRRENSSLASSPILLLFVFFSQLDGIQRACKKGLFHC